ncbi:MAG: hypothetical protein QM647_03315 [Asticcacaulis sp.]|uniref:hypothetical protein n=1 Tax=Asticcacaulis sp. TaxID=1872648 RepID=UPI0039E4404F
MFWVTRIFELLSATKKLNDAKPHVMTAVGSLTVVMLLTVFGALLAALMLSALLCLIYLQIVSAGGTVLISALITAALTSAILLAAGLWATAAFRRTQVAVERAFHSQAPIVAPVVNKVSDVAGAFISGLRTSRSNTHGPDKGRKKRQA